MSIQFLANQTRKIRNVCGGVIMERIETPLYSQGKKRYFATCDHPICKGKDGCEHCDLHPFDEEECYSVDCGMLEEPSECTIAYTRNGGKSAVIVAFL